MRAIIFLPLLVILAFHVNAEQKKWVDPFDMTGETTESAVVPMKKAPLGAKPPAPDFLDPVPHASDPVCPAKPQGIDYRAYYRLLVQHLWSKVGNARKRLNTDLLRALVRVPPRAEHVLDAFVNEDQEAAVQEVNEALDSMFFEFSAAVEVNANDTSAWFQQTQLREIVTYVMLALASVAILSPMFFIYRSNFCGTVRFLLSLFYLSLLWTWIVLYKKEVAKRRSAVLGQATACTPGPWFVELGHYLTSFLIVVPDQCTTLLEGMEVDPWLEVTPVRALVHMLTQMILEPSRPLAEHLVRFIRTVSGGLPIPHAIGALLVVVFVFVLLLTFCFGYRIRIPLLLSVEPVERGDSSKLAEQIEERLRMQICSTMERHHSVIMERSRLARRNSFRVERILTHRQTSKEGRERLLEETVVDSESGDEGPEERPPEVLT